MVPKHKGADKAQKRSDVLKPIQPQIGKFQQKGKFAMGAKYVVEGWATAKSNKQHRDKSHIKEKDIPNTSDSSNKFRALGDLKDGTEEVFDESAPVSAGCSGFTSAAIVDPALWHKIF